MHIYEVVPIEYGAGFNDHIVIAKNKENAKRMVIDNLNMSQTWHLYTESDFVVNDEIDPDDYPEETMIC